MLRAWSEEKPVTLVNPWDVWGRDFRIVPLFQAIIMRQELGDSIGPCYYVEDICGELIVLGNENKAPVKILINSPGGSLVSGYMLIQAIEHLKNLGIEVWTVNFFATRSMASVILMAGTHGRRYAIDGGVTHTHGGTQGGAGRPDDVEEMTKFQSRIKGWLYDFISRNSKIPEFRKAELGIKEPSSAKKKRKKKRLNQDSRIKLIRDFLQVERYLTAGEAKEAGIVDDILCPGDNRINQIFSKSD